ncbi:TPA: hypothetical protein EYN98_24025 [Candidatus Poribacteria bacterium]|nr:hypothetical protein [Candidatus Poribacteria bacterium]HIB92519.1 hypothetical protein [Candidatus Poribacteria bacterium]
MSMFSDPKLIQLVQKNFVPVAIDIWYLRRQEDEKGRFVHNLIQQHYDKPVMQEQIRQGIYHFTADGTLLNFRNHRDPEIVKSLIDDSLIKFCAGQIYEDTLQFHADARYDRQPPPNGIILNTYSRILLTKSELGLSTDQWSRNLSTGRDHVWLTEEEWRSMFSQPAELGDQYPIPKSILERIVRFHLVDNVRGEPSMWNTDNIKDAEMNLTVMEKTPENVSLSVEGSACLEADEKDRGFVTHLSGILEYNVTQKQFERFDLLAKGNFWGEGLYTGGAPKGKFPLVIAFQLADSHIVAGSVPPQGTRSPKEYFGN